MLSGDNTETPTPSAITFANNESASTPTAIAVVDNSADPKTVAKENPFASDGTDYKNYYKADANANIITLRDPIRYANVELEKVSFGDTSKTIANISFKLYKYTGKDQNGNFTGVQSVLQEAKVMVCTSPTFYRWVFGFCGSIKILGPEPVVEKYHEMARLALE